ncbi:MAG: GntR family transcriptional regulator [Janthinobacterium lividum]
MLRTLSIAKPEQADSPAQLAVLIRDHLLALPVKGGERIFEAQMARDLDVGRPLLREACRILEEEGLLTYVQNRGYALRVLTARDVSQLIEFRMILEEAAFVSAALSDDRVTIVQKLREAFHEIERISGVGDTAQQISADLAFHRVVVAAADNPWLLQSFDRMGTVLRYAIRLMGRPLRNFKIDVSSHRALVTCLAEGDPERMRAEMRSHINLFVPDLVERLEEDSTRKP